MRINHITWQLTVILLEDFLNKKTIKDISEKFNFTKVTISRNLKKSLGEKKYFELINNLKSEKESPNNQNLLEKDVKQSNNYS